MAKKIRTFENDPLAQEAYNKGLKVITNINPYFAKANQGEITTIEQVTFFHKKVKESKVLGDFLKEKKSSPSLKKKVIKDLIKYWDKEFRDHIDSENNKILERTSKINRKRIKKIRFTFVYFAGFLGALAMILTTRAGILKGLPFIGKYFDQISQMLENTLYYNLMVAMVYLVLILGLYLVILKTYFETLRKMGMNAEAFIGLEFKKIKVNFVSQQKKLRVHLLKSRRKSFKKTYKINNIFDAKEMIGKLEGYSTHIEKRVTKFRKKYYWLLFLQHLLKLGIIGITGFIGYSYYVTYF